MSHVNRCVCEETEEPGPDTAARNTAALAEARTTMQRPCITLSGHLCCCSAYSTATPPLISPYDHRQTLMICVGHPHTSALQPPQQLPLGPVHKVTPPKTTLILHTQLAQQEAVQAAKLCHRKSSVQPTSSSATHAPQCQGNLQP
jgi:hypothetical protein